MLLEIEMLAAWISAIGVIAAPLLYIIRLSKRLLDRIAILEAWSAKQQEDIEHSKEERQILLSGTLACLKGLKEQGVNGPVTQGIKDIEDFLLEEAHKGQSR